MLRHVPPVFVLASSCFSVWATVAPDPFEHISIYANRQSLTVKEQLTSVVVFDRTAIEHAQVSDVPALLAQVAGVQLSRSGGKGHSTTVFIRGGAAGHTLVLIDGVRLGAATLGYTSLADLPLQHIERIEVIKGPKAVLYGSDALSGVIAITTRQAQRTEVTLRTGRYGSVEGDVAGAATFDDVTLRASLGFSRADGFDLRGGAQPDADGYDQRFAKVSAKYQTDLGLFGAQHHRYVQDVEFDADPNWGGPDLMDTETEVSSLNWQYLGQGSEQKLSLSRQKQSDLNYGNASFETLFQTRRSELDYQYHRTLTSSLVALVGFNWYQEEVAGTQYSVSSRTNQALFAGLSYKQSAWLLDVAIRQDHQSQYGQEATYQLAAGYQISPDLQLRFSRATAFKAPSFNDLYYPYSGNANLKPEEALSHEVSLRYSFLSWQLEVSGYQQETSNLIQWMPDAFEMWLPTNIGKAKLQGAELTLNQEGQLFSQQLNYGYLDAKDVLTQARLVKKSRHTLFWQGDISLEKVRFFLNSRYQSDFNTGDYVEPVQGGFTLFGVGLSYPLTSDARLSFKVDNLTNKHYQYVPGFATAGQEWSLQVTTRF